MNLPPDPSSSLLRRALQPRPWKWDAWLLAACIAAAGLASIAMGQDANWDLQNYHFYNPWAWLSGRIYTTDIVAAQLQTYHNPLPDIPFYLMVKWGWRPRTIAFMLAIPAGVAAFFLIKTLRVLFGDVPLRDRWLPMGAALAVSLSSGMAIAVLGTTMNEWPGAALTMAAIFVVVRALAGAPAAPLPRNVLLGAGLLCGLASGAKLTFGVFAVGLCVAILLRGPLRRGHFRRAVTEAFVFGIAVLVGTAITGGAWMWALWTHFANPIFPYANIWIKSPWWGEYEVMGRPYGPHTLAEWLRFPFDMASPRAWFVTEQKYTDARFAVLYGFALLAAAAAMFQRVAAFAERRRGGTTRVAPVPAVWRLIGVFWVVSFVIWTAQYSIYRYLVPLELLAGALLVALLKYLLKPGASGPAIVLVGAALIATTSPPDWWRVEFGRRWFDVKVPYIAPNSLVLLTTDGPMAYVLPFLPADARFFGLNNSINDPKRETLMEESIERAIREHKGPLYSLTYPAGIDREVLAAHRLLHFPETCSEIRTNMRTSPIQLCQLTRFPK
jgi:hypothetical protein